MFQPDLDVEKVLPTFGDGLYKEVKRTRLTAEQREEMLNAPLDSVQFPKNVLKMLKGEGIKNIRGLLNFDFSLCRIYIDGPKPAERIQDLETLETIERFVRTGKFPD